MPDIQAFRLSRVKECTISINNACRISFLVATTVDITTKPKDCAQSTCRLEILGAPSRKPEGGGSASPSMRTAHYMWVGSNTVLSAWSSYRIALPSHSKRLLRYAEAIRASVSRNLQGSQKQSPVRKTRSGFWFLVTCRLLPLASLTVYNIAVIPSRAVICLPEDTFHTQTWVLPSQEGIQPRSG